MNWQPGQLVLTASDQAHWLAWRKARKLELQRQRRARYPRIDYYPCAEVRALISDRTRAGVGGDNSSVIDALVLAAFRKKVRPSAKGSESYAATLPEFSLSPRERATREGGTVCTSGIRGTVRAGRDRAGACRIREQ